MDMSKTNLSGIDLRGAQLAHVKLNDVRIDKSTQLDEKWMIVYNILNRRGTLPNGYLRGKDLSEANLEGAYLRELDLCGTNLYMCDLDDANLFGAKIDRSTTIGDKYRIIWEILNDPAKHRRLNGLDLQGANLRDRIDYVGLSFQRSTLDRCVLSFCNLEGARFDGASLLFADLSHSRLFDASLINIRAPFCNFDQSELDGANLTKADLLGASFKGATLVKADLRSASLRGAKLEDAVLTGSLYDASTRLPDGFDAVQAGMLLARESQ